VIGMTTEAADPRPAGLRAVHDLPTGTPKVKGALGRPLTGQLVRFAGVGVASTVAYGLLFLLLRPLTGAFAANALALLITALANTAVNRRLTFGVRGPAGLAGDHVVGLLAFGAGLALTSGALALLHAAGSTGKGGELAVLTVANATATLLRFAILRVRIGSH
jgi:putative flippase GtrA